MSRCGRGFSPDSPEVVVIGAGPAGLFAAWRLLDEGLSVVVLEARPQASWGQRWCVDVEERYFTGGILPTPGPDVELKEGRPSGLLARPPEGGRRRWSKHRFPIRTLRLWRLQEDLLGRIRDQGGEVRFGHKVIGVDRDGSGDVKVRPRRGRELRCRALVIAAGTRPVDDPSLERIFGIKGDLEPSDCVHAHHDIREINPHLFTAAPGEFAQAGTILRFGVGGDSGFSMEKLACHPDEERLLCLAATFPQDGQRLPLDVLTEVPARIPFAGRILASKGQAIPLRRPQPALAGRGVALIGDAGCQTMPLSGSGTGLSALAATLLAPAMRRYIDTGQVQELWEYSRAYHMKMGAEQLRQELVLRISRSLPASRIQALANDGVLQIEDFRRVQREGRMIPSTIFSREQLSRLSGLPRFLGLAPAVARTAASMLAAELIYRGYPKDPKGVERWSSRVKRLLT